MERRRVNDLIRAKALSIGADSPNFNRVCFAVAKHLGVELVGSVCGWKQRHRLALVILGKDPSAHSDPPPQAQRARVQSQQGGKLQGKIDAFYASWEWKRLRYDFIKDKQRKCQCCGATPETGTRIVVDHVKPIRHHWHLRLDSANLQLLCDDCNMGKGSRDETDWRGTNVVPIRA